MSAGFAPPCKPHLSLPSKVKGLLASGRADASAASEPPKLQLPAAAAAAAAGTFKGQQQQQQLHANTSGFRMPESRVFGLTNGGNSSSSPARQPAVVSRGRSPAAANNGTHVTAPPAPLAPASSLTRCSEAAAAANEASASVLKVAKQEQRKSGSDFARIADGRPIKDGGSRASSGIGGGSSSSSGPKSAADTFGQVPQPRPWPRLTHGQEAAAGKSSSAAQPAKVSLYLSTAGAYSDGMNDAPGSKTEPDGIPVVERHNSWLHAPGPELGEDLGCPPARRATEDNVLAGDDLAPASPTNEPAKAAAADESCLTAIHPFNTRMMTLANLPQSTASSGRARSAAVQRARAGVTDNSARSLTLLRQTLQKSITRDICSVIQGYVDKYFRPAVEALCANKGDNAAGADHLAAICREMLDEAKKSYLPTGSGGGGSGGGGGVAGSLSCSNTPRGSPAHPTNSGPARGGGDTAVKPKVPLSQRFQELQQPKPLPVGDGGATAASMPATPRKRGRPRKVPLPLVTSDADASVTGWPAAAAEKVVRLPKYDPALVNASTRFITGSRANSALGLGATRGKVYQRHPELFKYAVDPADKHWLQERHFIRPSGGATYLMLLDEIRELATTSMYRECSGVLLSELTSGFEIPDWMLAKVQSHMIYLHGSVSRIRPTSSAISSVGASDVATGSALQPNDSRATVAPTTMPIEARAGHSAAETVRLSDFENEAMPLMMASLVNMASDDDDDEDDGDDDDVDDGDDDEYGPPDLPMQSD